MPGISVNDSTDVGRDPTRGGPQSPFGRAPSGVEHSWHGSYHRTMTQLAVGDNVIGDFENVTLGPGVWSIHLTRDGDSYLADMVDPDWELRQLWKTKLDPVATPPRARRRVVMTTGIHHYQAYWVPSEYGRMLINFPYVFLDGRWVRREAVFLRPPDAARHYQQWNTSCIRCHSVAGEPGLDPESNRLGASVLLPRGFFLGGVVTHAGDPGLGILLVPVGALLLLTAIFLTARRS